jgi:hypothetical protein
LQEEQSDIQNLFSKYAKEEATEEETRAFFKLVSQEATDADLERLVRMDLSSAEDTEHYEKEKWDLVFKDLLERTGAGRTRAGFYSLHGANGWV